MTQVTTNSLLPEFLKSLEDLKRSPSTILAYRADLEQLVAYLLSKNKATLDQIKTEDLESFRDALLAQKYTPKSVSRKLNAVKTFFRYLISENKLSTDPSVGVAHPKIEASMPKFLSPLQYRALRDVVRGDTRIAAIVEIILQSGLRISEIANLKLEKVKNGKVTIEAHATQPERTIPFNKPAKLALEGYLKDRPKTDSPFVFVSKNGNPLAVRNIRAAVDRYMQRAEIPGFSVNDLRTTFIVENLKAGADLVLISQIVGHKRLSTTERYLELAERKDSGKNQTLEEL